MQRTNCSCLAVALAAAISVGVLASGPSAKAADPVKLKVFFTSQHKASAEPIIAKFESANPGIEIEASYATFVQHAPLLLTQIGGGNAPDVWWSGPGNALVSSPRTLAKKGLLLDLTKRPWTKKISPQFKPSVSYHGKVYAVLIDATATGILYNKTFSSELGLKVPKTFTDVLANCKKSAAKGKPYFLQPIKGSIALPTAAAADWVPAKWFNKRRAGKAKFASSPEWKTAYQRIAQMKNAKCFQEGAASLDVGTSLGQLAQRQGVAQVAGIHQSGPVKALDPKDAWGFVPFPGDKPKSTRVPVFGGSTFAVNAKTPHKDAAIKFVDFLARPDISAQWTAINGTIPPARFRDGKFAGIAAPLKSVFKAKQFSPSISGEFWNTDSSVAMTDGMAAIWAGQKSAAQVLGEVDKAWSKGPA